MAEPKTDSAPACEYLNVHEDAVAQVLAPSAFLWVQDRPQAHLLFTMV